MLVNILGNGKGYTPIFLLSLWTSILKALAYHLLQNDYVGQLYGILGALHACLFPLYTLTQGISPYPYI